VAAMREPHSERGLWCGGNERKGARLSRCCVLVAFSNLNDTEFLIRRTSAHVAALAPPACPANDVCGLHVRHFSDSVLVGLVFEVASHV